MSKVVYTLAEPATNWILSRENQQPLNSARLTATDERLGPWYSMDWVYAGSGGTTLRDPLYVFAVNDLFTAATMTDEVAGFAHRF